MVLIGRGPLGCGMEETYQITSALKYLKWGKEVALITDARFSGCKHWCVHRACRPEALAGGPIGKVREGDWIEIIVDRNQLVGSVNLIGKVDGTSGQFISLSTDEAAVELASRLSHPGLKPDADLPDDTRLWAALQQVGGGTWGGCI